jgi:phosphate transport system substrate-binding protein
MNEDFLHRIRVQPSPQFLARLKAKLDRQPSQEPRARLVRSLAAGLLIGVSALAVASLALRGEFAGWRWTGWGVAYVGSDHMGTGTAANTSAEPGTTASRNGWGSNPWASASQPPPEKSPRKAARKAASGTVAVIPIPPSSTAAPGASAARYSIGPGLVPALPPRVRIAISPEADVLTKRIVQRFVRAGNNQPEISVELTDRLLVNLCSSANPVDFAIMPRQMTAAESAKCRTPWNGPSTVDVRLGSEAVVLVRSKLYGVLSLSMRDIYLALAKTIPDPANPAALAANHYLTWSEVNPALPPDRIQVLGPALDSEMGQAFLTLVMERGCDTVPSLAALAGSAHESACRDVRDDGVYADAPEGYPALVQKLQMLPTVLAIVPYGMLQLTGDALVASPIDDVEPTIQSIASASYPGSRALHLYVNRNRRGSAMRGFLQYSLDTVDVDNEVGVFIPLPRAERAEIRTNALNALTQ